ncbi:MAG: hypothetical protein Q8K46_02980, partial [Deltaproteobacteria bacterium]|nr:hypothetical protein [Deltaproteobacteria bacterium]
FDLVIELFKYYRTRDSDENNNTWTTQVVVYDKDDCSNPSANNNPYPIVGFATVTITSVIPPGPGYPAGEISGKVICEFVKPGRSGGGSYGTLGSIPGLVQ